MCYREPNTACYEWSRVVYEKRIQLQWPHNDDSKKGDLIPDNEVLYFRQASYPNSLDRTSFSTLVLANKKKLYFVEIR